MILPHLPAASATRGFRIIRASLLCSAIFPTVGAAGDAPASAWVHPGADGKLVYKTTPAGDRIMDFSAAGYRGGGVALPQIATAKTVKPSGGADDSAALQEAINAVGALPLKDGFRGAVELAPGTFVCTASLVISKSGVVVRGAGSGAGGTIIKMAGSPHSAITIGAPPRRRARPAKEDEDAEDETAPAASSAAAGKAAVAPSAQTVITDAYVAAGTNVFTVANAKDFSVGDTVAIHRPTTPAWLSLMGMDTLKRDGHPQTWIGTNRGETQERKITAISGNTLTVDIPLADSYDAKYLGANAATVSRIQPSSPVANVGVEHLHIQCPPLEIAYGQAPYRAIRVGGDDCWVKDVYCEETMNSTTLAGKRITLENVVITHTYPNLGASKPTDFSIEGSQILIDRCRVTGDNEYFVWTASLYPGPNVLLNCTFNGRVSRIQPHMRWSTGMLIDNCRVPDGGIDYMNRGVAGSGHGWTMGWAVAWNCLARTYVIQNPPGSANWAIGCTGERQQTARLFDSGPLLPEGYVDSPGQPVAPRSLYLAQLLERRGPEALEAIGYPKNNDAVLTDPGLHRLPPLASEDDPVLGPDLALHRPINTGNIRHRSREFGGEKAVDADPNTYWATDDANPHATLEVDLEGPVDLNALVIEEAPQAGSHVQEYKVEAQVDSDWTLLAHGTTIGEHKVDRFPRVCAWKVRLTVLKSDAFPAIRKFGLYLAPAAEPKKVAAK
jgi:hypothetical protein